MLYSYGAVSFWCGITVLIVSAATKKKREEPIDSYVEKLEQVFDYFAKFGVNILL
jgi:hypothetical protein